MFHSYISSWAVRNVIVENVKFHIPSHWAVYNLRSKYTSGSIVGHPRDREGDLHQGEDRHFTCCLN